MTLPNAEHAIINPPKLRDYLLSPVHPVGRFKAVFFNSLGFTREDWQSLADSLHALAQGGVCQPGEQSEYGQKYEVRGILSGPSDSAPIVAVWIMLVGEEAPRFVTAL